MFILHTFHFAKITEKIMFIVLSTLALLIANSCVCAKSEPGITEGVLTPDSRTVRLMRPMLAYTQIFVKVECETANHQPLNISIVWTLIENECWYDDASLESGYLSNEYQRQQQHNKSVKGEVGSSIYEASCPNHFIVLPPSDANKIQVEAKGEQVLAPVSNPAEATKVAQTRRALEIETKLPVKQSHPKAPVNKPIAVVSKDGIYMLTISIQDTSVNGIAYTMPVHIEVLGPHGYISATDWPLLPFYCIMCVVYVAYGIVWLVVSFMQWRDLLRIQFWIGGVILLGMLEKAFFYAQYNSFNHTGIPMQGAELTAEFVSCAKRTLARMLVIIMSLGFGIVKPRLGAMLHRVVGVGSLYFVLACVESYLRVMRTQTDERNQLLVASIPLAVLDTGICWWIFTSLVQTTRTLRLRRNMVKLSLYRHFTNTLIFSVFASVIFMLYALRLRKTENCTPGWTDIWLDSAFWHVLFSVLLLVIMILWRPTNNNQRYAFTPLLDNPEDEDEEEDQFVVDAYGVKMRGTTSNGARTPPASHRGTTTEEDDLRWVEENIPSSMSEPALPVLDSDEEIINTKFEVSKMQ